MWGSVPAPKYKLDAEGHLPPGPNETEPELIMRHAQVLWEIKATKNRPNAVSQSMGLIEGTKPPPIDHGTNLYLDSISPSSMTVGNGKEKVDLHCYGANFTSKSVIQTSGVAQNPTTFWGATHVSCKITRASSPGSVSVTVKDGATLTGSKVFTFV